MGVVVRKQARALLAADALDGVFVRYAVVDTKAGLYLSIASRRDTAERRMEKRYLTLAIIVKTVFAWIIITSSLM